MKKKKLKGFVLPTIYVLVIGVLFMGISYLGSVLETKKDYPDMAVSALKDDVKTVIKDETKNPSKIVKPFTSTSVKITRSYYDMTDDEEKQENSLVYYEKTYLQNSGTLYSSDEKFDVLCSLDGTVTNVSSDDVLGNFVEITHNPNLKTVYYSLKDVAVKKDDVLKSGDIIGVSGENLLESASQNNLLFEVYHNGFAIDPEDFYNMQTDELN